MLTYVFQSISPDIQYNQDTHLIYIKKNTYTIYIYINGNNDIQSTLHNLIPWETCRDPHIFVNEVSSPRSARTQLQLNKLYVAIIKHVYYSSLNNNHMFIAIIVFKLFPYSP